MRQKPNRNSYPLISYVDNQKKRIGYAYITDNGNICIRGEKMLDKSLLGRLLVNKGVYVELPDIKTLPPSLQKIWATA